MFGGDVFKLHIDVCVVVRGVMAFKDGGLPCVECSILLFVVTVIRYESSPSVTAPIAGAALPASFGGSSSRFLLWPFL